MNMKYFYRASWLSKVIRYIIPFDLYNSTVYVQCVLSSFLHIRKGSERLNYMFRSRDPVLETDFGSPV